MLYYLHCSIVKNLLPVLKIQNGVYIQDGVENIYIYHPIFSKNMTATFKMASKMFIKVLFLPKVNKNKRKIDKTIIFENINIFDASLNIAAILIFHDCQKIIYNRTVLEV
jgi:hypothetical protein